MRRSAAWKPIAGVAAATIAIAGFGVAPATAAPDDPEQALAQVLGSNLLASELIDSGIAYTGTSEAQNPDAEDLDVSALSALELELADGLQLPLIDSGTNSGLLSLGSAGVLSSYASTSSDSSVAASGILGTGGAIGVDTDPPVGTPPTASVDLTQAFDRLGLSTITDDIVSELTLELGAFAARAETDGTTVDDEYALADLTLELDSPAVGRLATAIDADLTATTTALDTTLDALAGPGGAIDTAFSALNLQVSVNLAGIPLPTVLGLDASGGALNLSLPDLTSALDTALDDVPSTPDIELVSDGVTLNLTQGTVSLDLETLAGGLDALEPNTSVLTPAVLTRITTAVTTLLGGVTGNVTQALQDAIDATAVTLVVPVDIELLGGSVATTNVNVSGTLGGFLAGQGTVSVTDTTILSLDLGVDALTSAVLGAVSGPVLTILGGLVDDGLATADTGISEAVADLGVAAGTLLTALTPAFDALDDVARITVNAQPTALDPPLESDLGPDGFTVRALDLVLLPGLTGSPLASIALGSASVLNVEPTVVDPTLALDPTQVRAGGSTTISGAGWDSDGGDVVVTFRSGSTVVGTPVTATLNADGTIAGTFTVPAGTDVGTLTATAVQGDATATADLAVIAAPVVIVDPDPVDPGDTITISGSGFLCGPVTVTISSGDAVLQTIADVPVGADGSWSTTYVVPADIAVNTLTISAVATDECGDEDDTDVEVDLDETLELTPAQVRVGDTVSIDGTGWAAGTVTVTFTNAAGQVGAPELITVGADGVLDGAFEVPAGTAAGSLTGTAVQGDDTSIDAVLVLVEPTVVVDPDPVDPGGTITVTGSGFACGPVDVTIADGDTELTVIADVPVAADGTWSTTYVVPADTDATSLTITAIATGDCGDEGETDVEVDQPETLDLAPALVRVGDDVAIDGTGWAQGDVTVTFTNADGPVGAPVTIAVGADGIIDGSFEVPAGTAAGPLTGTATQGDDEVIDSIAVITAPILIVDPDPVDPGGTITITGSGFACGPVDVTVADGDTELVVIEDVAVAADGTWSTTYVVPADIDALSLTITAIATGECGDEGETDVEVDQPETLVLTPTEVRAGDDVAIDGTGWSEGTVTVTFTNAAGQVGSPVLVAIGADGILDGSFEVPAGTATGTLTGTAEQGDDSETDSVTVFGDVTVAVDPTSVRAGGTVDVTGTGWLPNGGDVVVTVTDADDEVVGTVTIDEADLEADGSFADVFEVPDGTAPGTLTVTAEQGGVEAGTSLTVLPEPSVTVSPTTVRPLDEVTVGGSGWGPGTVTVVFTDEDDEPVGEPLELTPVDGVISGTFTVPEGTDPGTLTATATQGGDSDTTELEVTLAPTVTATPPRVHGGDAVAIGGSGWGVDPVTVTITDGETIIGTPITLSPVDGVITGSYPIPEGTDAGDLTVTAEDEVDTATTAVEVVADAVVDADPDPADPGDVVTITGTGFLCGPVDVTITSGSTTIVTFTNVAVVDDAWTQVWTVPIGIDVDSVTIAATTAAAAPCDDEGATELEIDLDETLAATPATVERGDVVTVTGTGWSDGTVSIIARGVGGIVVGSFTATSADAAFSTPFTVPAGTPLGALTFTAVQGAKSETTAVTVVQVPTGPATLIVSPSAVEAGDTVAIDGEGYDPTAGTVEITVRDASGATVGTVTAAVQPDGALFTAAFQVPGTLQPQQLTATAVQGPRTASDTFDVRASNLPVIRLAGPDRVFTAIEIARDAFPFGADVVYVANSLKFPDALSAAPAAAQTDSPLLLTLPDRAPAALLEELDRLDPETVVIVGDELSVSAETQAQIAPYAGEVVRLGGVNRFETSLLIAEYAFDAADSAYIATGYNFPDALTAGAAAGASGSPMILTYGAAPTAELLGTLDELGVSDVYIAGDENAVAGTQEAAFEAAGFEVVERYAGTGRYDTGVLVSRDSFTGPSARIYVATGERFPDALAGSAVAGAQGVPVFVTPPTCMWDDVLDEVDRLGGPQIVLLGDQLALDNNVFDLQPCGI